MAFGTEFTVDTSDLRAIAKGLKAVQPALAKEFTAQLAAGGRLVAAKARLRAAWFSSRIPDTIRVKASGVRVSVAAGGRSAPHAAPFEHQGVAGEFRHPVFGNRDVWVKQQAHPYLGPALEESGAQLEQLVERAVTTTFARLGFH